jgi:F0F1-type ATP synthase assembly protein I
MRKEALKTLFKSEIITFIITLITGCIMYLFSLNYGWLNSIEALLIMGLLLCLFLLICFPAYFDKGLGEKMKDSYRKELLTTSN